MIFSISGCATTNNRELYLSRENEYVTLSGVSAVPGLDEIYQDAVINEGREEQPVHLIQYDDCEGFHGRAVRDVMWKHAPNAFVLCRHITTSLNSRNAYNYNILIGNHSVHHPSIGIVLDRANPQNIERDFLFSDYETARADHRVVNISLSGPLQGRLPSSYTNRQTLYVVAADNNHALNGPEDDYYRDIALSFLDKTTTIVVVALDKIGSTLAFYSSPCGWAKDYCMAASGEVSTVDGKIALGTSFATPLVTSAAAALFQYWPNMNAIDARDLLFRCAKDLGNVGIDDVYGHGGLSFITSLGQHCLSTEDARDIEHDNVKEKDIIKEQFAETSAKENMKEDESKTITKGEVIGRSKDKEVKMPAQTLQANQRVKNVLSLWSVLVNVNNTDMLTAYDMPKQDGWTIAEKSFHENHFLSSIQWSRGHTSIGVGSHAYQNSLASSMNPIQIFATAGYAHKIKNILLTATVNASYTTNIPLSYEQKSTSIHAIRGMTLVSLSYQYGSLLGEMFTGVGVGDDYILQQPYFTENRGVQAQFFLGAKVRF